MNEQIDSIFAFHDYKEFLKSAVYAKTAPRGIQSANARAARCQVAYLNQTINGKPQLSMDHGYRIADYLNISTTQKDYFLTMIQLTQAQDENHKTYLKKRMEQIHHSNKQTA